MKLNIKILSYKIGHTGEWFNLMRNGNLKTIGICAHVCTCKSKTYPLYDIISALLHVYAQNIHVLLHDQQRYFKSQNFMMINLQKVVYIS